MAIKVYTKTLSSADMLSLASAFKIFNAPLSGTVNAILGISFKLNFNTIAYTGSTDLRIHNLTNTLLFWDRNVFLASSTSEAAIERIDTKQCVLTTTKDLYIEANALMLNGNSTMDIKIIYENIIYHT